ncbi:hypothetical protein ENSA7_59520 [Enhygromyxa salina]|uniref:DUF6798 domain-containing protein n=1 Tax=Enhygromyxa salina TaxID=215803 RepID=A0A2S9Y5T5_9BACT|nr:hypothetical protein ENSA7_59520 [Enhygromyxa salina]
MAVACGLFATAWRYQFLEPGTLQLLAPVMRAADPQFLAGDFYTWAGSVFGPRTPLITLLGMLARVIPYDRLYLGLTALANVGLALVSYASARALVPDAPWAPRIAAALVCCAPIPAIGGPSICAATALTPEGLALPLLAASLYFGLLAFDDGQAWRRGVAAGIPASLAVLLAPGLAVPSAALLVSMLLVRRQGADIGAALRSSGVTATLVAPSVALVVAPIFTHPRSLADETFVALAALQRDPGRYSPSHVFADWTTWATLLSLVVVTLICARRSSRPEPPPERHLVRSYLILAAGLALLVLLSHVFVDRWAWRAWLLFTPLRCCVLLAWIALLVAAGHLARLASDPVERAWVPALGLSLAAPLLAGGCFVLVAWLAPRLERRQTRLLVAASLALLVAVAIGLGPPALAPTLVLSLVCLALTIASWRGWSLALALAGGIAGVAVNQSSAWLADDFRPRWRSSDYQRDALMLARDVARYTPPASVILTPPAFGDFRLIATRAIVVDFDGVPDHDPGVAEWGTRMFDCYGPPEGPGRAAIPGYERRYAALTDAELAVIGGRYRANFAVVASDRATTMRVLYVYGDYALVVLPRR